MNSENQVAVLQQILPAQNHGHEPYLQKSRSNSGIDLDRHVGSDQSVGSSADKVRSYIGPGVSYLLEFPQLSPCATEPHARQRRKRTIIFVLKQAAASSFAACVTGTATLTYACALALLLLCRAID